MAKIRIVTDSTAYLSEDIVKELGITVVPLSVNFQGESFPEGSCYTNRDFFAMVEASPVLPTTSQPSSGAFMEAFQQLFAKDAEEIVCVFISPGISGTYYSAEAAIQAMNTEHVHLFDSAHTVNVQGFMAVTAAKMANRGKSVTEIMAALEDIRQNSSLYFIVQTLENLRKGGRIGGAASLIGTLLQVKPILCLRQGKIDLFEKVRTRARALARVNELLAESMAGGRPHRISVLHVGAPEDAEEWASQLRTQYPGQAIEIVEAGQVIGTHVGRGTIGLCFNPLVDYFA